MSYKIYEDSGCIRIDKDDKFLFIAKTQVKSINIIRASVIRIDIGEGPLRDIFVRFSEVELPAVGSIFDLLLILTRMIPNLSRDINGD